MKVLIILIAIIGITFGTFTWSFVGLEKTGRMSECASGEVVWSSSKGFNDCVNLEF